MSGRYVALSPEFEKTKAELEGELLASGKGFAAKMGEALTAAYGEIERLRGIIRDNTEIPERYPVAVSAAVVPQERGPARRLLFAVANDHSMWARGLDDRNWDRWDRIPGLPQASEEIGE
ncbi:hypothetical protein [Acidisoma sp. 7E03]